MKFINQFRGLPAQVYWVCIVRLIAMTGNLIVVMTSLLYTDVLGLSDFTAGLLAMGSASCNVAGNLFGGKMADYYGRKKIYFIFTCITCCLYLAGSFLCRTFAIIPICYCAFFFSNACYPMLAAMIADSANGHPKEAECFSLLYLCHNLGFALGPSLGGFLFYKHLNLVFIIQLSFFMCAAIILMLKTNEIYAVSFKGKGQNLNLSDHEEAQGDDVKTGTWEILKRSPYMIVFIAAFIVMTALYVSTSFLLPLQMSETFGSERGAGYSSLIWMVNGFGIVFLTPILVTYTKKTHQFKCMALGCVLYFVGFGLYAFANSLFTFYASTMVWTIGEIIVSTGAGVFIAENSLPSHKARFQSLYEFARNAGRAVGPVFYGILLLRLNYRSVWGCIAVGCLITGGLVAMAYKKGIASGGLKKKGQIHE